MTRYIVLVGFLILTLNIALAVLFLRVAGAEPSTTPVDAVMLEAQPCTLVAVYARGYSIWHCVRQFKEEGVIIEIETQPSGNVRYIPDPCLALMEQAMRAMEPHFFSIERRFYDYDPGVTRAEHIWSTAKAQCWREK